MKGLGQANGGKSRNVWDDIFFIITKLIFAAFRNGFKMIFATLKAFQ